MVLHLHRKKIIALLAALAVALTVPLSFISAPAASYAADSGVKLSKAYSATKTKLKSIGDEAGWSADTDWIVFSLARAGELSSTDGNKYYSAVRDKVTARASAQLNADGPAENCRTILALTAAGQDVTNVSGYNLLDPLADAAYVSKQGISGPIWTLIALDSKGYNIPAYQGSQNGQTTRESLIKSILGAQLSSSGKKTGWTASGSAADVDLTCMAVTALAPYYDTMTEVTSAVDAAMAWLKSVQDSTGGFSSGSTKSSESDSWVMVALATLGLNPHTASDYVKNKNSAVNALLSYFVDGGGFKHVSDNAKANNLASIQAFYAMTAYYRLLDKANALFNLGDAGKYTVDTSKHKDIPEDSETSDEAAKVKAVKIKGVRKANIGTTYANIKWTPQSKVFDGYEIYYKRAGNYSSKSITVADSKASLKYVGSLTSGKSYTFKVRGYKKINGKKVYGKYSDGVIAKIKKPTPAKKPSSSSSSTTTRPSSSTYSSTYPYRSSTSSSTYSSTYPYRSSTSSSTYSSTYPYRSSTSSSTYSSTYPYRSSSTYSSTSPYSSSSSSSSTSPYRTTRSSSSLSNLPGQANRSNTASAGSSTSSSSTTTSSGSSSSISRPGTTTGTTTGSTLGSSRASQSETDSDSSTGTTGTGTDSSTYDPFGSSSTDSAADTAEQPKANEVKQMPKALPWIILGGLALAGLIAVLLIKFKPFKKKPGAAKNASPEDNSAPSSDSPAQKPDLKAVKPGDAA